MMMVDEVVNNEVENAEIQINSIIGYSLSDQHILLPISPRYYN